MLAFLEAHRAEVEAHPAGSLRFDWHRGPAGDELRVTLEHSRRLPASRPDGALVG